MTRMERRRRRRRIARIRFAMAVVTLAAVGCTVAAITSIGEAEGKEVQPTTVVETSKPKLVTLEFEESAPQPTETAFVEDPEEPLEENENELIEQALLEQGYFYKEIPLDFDLQAHLIAVCDEYGVPMNIALGVIQAESTFAATAQNGNCYGYMQINSINSEWLNERIGVTDLTDPYQNIRSGVYILSDLYGKYGDWHKALVAYNYGPTGAREHVFSQGYTTTSYSRTVMAYADEWAEVLE